MSVLKLTDENFENEVLNSDKPCLVDFYADWCGPCKMMSPIIEEIADELGDTVKVGKVNSDENMELTEKYQIMSIPTIMVIKNGQIVKTFVGVTAKEEIQESLK
jgi:thioredoxin 1